MCVNGQMVAINEDVFYKLRFVAENKGSMKLPVVIESIITNLFNAGRNYGPYEFVTINKSAFSDFSKAFRESEIFYVCEAKCSLFNAFYSLGNS